MSQQDFVEQIQTSLEQVRPSLQADGGDVEFVDADIETGKVSVRLTGACHGCPHATVTLKMGIEQVLRRQVPGVTEVEDVSWR